jgi:AcrR family transcriptional regulator
MDPRDMQGKVAAKTGPSGHKSRLLEAMAHVVAEKGYAATTVADVVAAAGVSRRTFYEQFFDKDACLVELFDVARHNAFKVLRASIDPTHPWQTQVDHALRAYFDVLASNPALLQTLYVEILSLGRAGLAARRRMNQELANFMLEVVNGGAGKNAPLPAHMAMAVVGATNELVMEYIESDRVAQLKELIEPAAQLVRVVTSSYLPA